MLRFKMLGLEKYSYDNKSRNFWNAYTHAALICTYLFSESILFIIPSP